MDALASSLNGLLIVKKATVNIKDKAKARRQREDTLKAGREALNIKSGVMDAATRDRTIPAHVQAGLAGRQRYVKKGKSKVPEPWYAKKPVLLRLQSHDPVVARARLC